jgi:hypothetical protein
MPKVAGASSGQRRIINVHTKNGRRRLCMNLNKCIVSLCPDKWDQDILQNIIMKVNHSMDSEMIASSYLDIEKPKKCCLELTMENNAQPGGKKN